MIDHDEFRELAAGAVLDDLDGAERDALAAHLEGCPACRSVAAELREVVWDLALLTPDIAPPRSLQNAVLTAVRSSGTGDQPEDAPAITTIPLAVSARTDAADGPASPSVSARGRRRWASLAPLALAAVFGIVAVGLGVRVTQLTQENATAVAAAEQAQAQVAAREGAMAVLVSPDHETARLEPDALAPDAVAVAVFEPGTTESYVMVANLPASPSGHVYQLWYADTSGVHPLGTFHHSGTGAFVAPFGVDLGSSAAAMITLEPDGGAVGEPGPQVVFGEL